MGSPRRLRAVPSAAPDEQPYAAGEATEATPPAMDRSAAPASLVSQDAPLAELMLSVAEGSADSYERIYDAVADQVYGLALRVLRDPALAEDAAQEALLEVWTTAPRFDPQRGSARGWILTIAHRRAVDRVRREESHTTRARAAHAAVPSAAPTDDGPGRVVDTLHGEWEAARVRRALTGLTELQREALSLAYWRGLTHRELAGELGIPLGTAKARVRDGLLRMRALLEVAP